MHQGRDRCELWSRRAIWVCATLLAVSVAREIAALYAPAVQASDRVVPLASFDFGDVFSGETREHIFKITNGRATPMVVDRVVAECGCTTVSRKINGKTVAPMETLEVPVRWTAVDSEGPIVKRVVLIFGHTDRSPASLTIKARVKRRVSCSATRFVLNLSGTDQSASQTITVSRVSGAPAFDISSVTTSTSRLAAILTENSSGDETESRAPHPASWRITVRTVAPFGPGRTEASVFLNTSDPALPTIILPATIIAYRRPATETHNGVNGDN